MHFFKKTNLLLLTLFLFVVGAAYFFSLFDEYLDNERKYTEQTQKPYILQKLDYLSSFIIPSIEEQGDFDKLLEAEPTAALSNLSDITTTITQEALNSFTAPQEHPLPLLAHYNSGAVGVDEGMTPDYMISLIEEGNHILPSWRIEPSWKQELPDEYYQNSLLRAKELNLPLTFIIDPIESTLTNDSYYFTLSADQNPNVVDANGNILEKLSPLGPDALWSEVAQNFANSSLMQKIQQWYPNPPLVMFVDASSAKKLNWTELEDSQRYINRYGNTTDDNFKRTVIGAQWIEKYRLLHEGIKNSFSADAWKTNTKFIAYNPISLNIGTTSDWEANATLTNQHFSSWPLTTDGMNEQYYTDASTSSLNNNIFNINNIPFVLAQAYKQNAGFSYQLSITDYDAFDTANKYRGFAQLGLWLTRPNIIREFNNNTNDRNLITPHFQSIIDSVELIHNDDRLQNFWKNGQLVVNPTASIEQLLNVPSYYESADKWFLLDVDINPQPEWTPDTHIPVYAIALQTGVAPDREWLLLVQSFDGDQNNVAVTIPDYQDVFVSASESGNLYVISENTQDNIVSVDSNINKTATDTDGVDGYVSPYLEPVNLPTCDATNPEVQFINTVSDWSHINDLDKTIFCVSPGDYSEETITLTTSGTKDKRRYIVLNNGNDIHPGKLNKEELAKIGLILQDTNYWIIDRMAYWESYSTQNPIKIINSDNNIINRYFMDNVGNGIYLFPGSDNNTIQNSRIQRENINLHFDRAAIGLHDNRQSNIEIKNTKIINNEIKNFVDAFQSIRSSWTNQDGELEFIQNLNYEGTIIDGNIFYINNEIYTDCNGNHDPQGQCSYSENALDFKVGSLNPNNKVIVSNNIIFGYRETDSTNSTLDDPGVAITVHYSVDNIIISNNIISDSKIGLVITSPLPEAEFAVKNIKIESNIFDKIQQYGLSLTSVSNANINNNLFIDFYPQKSNIWGYEYWLLIYNSEASTFSNNFAINLDNRTARVNNNLNTFLDNQYYMAKPGDIPESGGITLQTIALKNDQNQSLLYDNFTTFPKIKLFQDIIR